VFEERIIPFAYSLTTGEIAWHEYFPQREKTIPDLFNQPIIVNRLKAAIDLPVKEIRFGEYFCHECKQWVDAVQDLWSVTICMSCSLDRGTDLWERYNS
jgi:hypothetical protein